MWRDWYVTQQWIGANMLPLVAPATIAAAAFTRSAYDADFTEALRLVIITGDEELIRHFVASHCDPDPAALRTLTEWLQDDNYIRYQTYGDYYEHYDRCEKCEQWYAEMDANQAALECVTWEARGLNYNEALWELWWWQQQQQQLQEAA